MYFYIFTLWRPKIQRLMYIYPNMCKFEGWVREGGYKGDHGMATNTCGVVGEKAQVILVWMRAPSVGNASHPQGLRVMPRLRRFQQA